MGNWGLWHVLAIKVYQGNWVAHDTKTYATNSNELFSSLTSPIFELETINDDELFSSHRATQNNNNRFNTRIREVLLNTNVHCFLLVYASCRLAFISYMIPHFNLEARDY